MILIASLVLTGCGLFGAEKDKEDMDPPGNAEVGDGEDTENTDGSVGEESEADETAVQTQLYLIDKDGFVVPRTFTLPYTEGIATQALEHLVTGGPVTEMLPDGFRAPLPSDTALSVNIKDGVATVNFSKEFADYAAEDELKILQAVTYTLTQFDSVKSVILQMNGNDLNEMPVNNTPISDELNRSIGINHDISNVVDITNTRPVTLYYVAQTDQESYFVPVTKRISNKEDDTVTAIVQELIKGPDHTSPLFSLLMSDVELLDKPSVKEGVVTLNFNENIYGRFEENVVTDHVLNALVLSLTEQDGIEGVAIQVNGKTDIVDEEGEALTEPVYRPKNVNTGSF